MTWDGFREHMHRLSGLKFAPTSLHTHWEALSDMPEPLLSAAIDQAQRESDEFPSPKMLRMYADRVRSYVVPVPVEEDRSSPNPHPTEAVIPQTGRVLPLKRFWKYYCNDCQDSGLLTFWCGDPETNPHPWNDSIACGRREGHYDGMGHEWSKGCPCADTNPDVQRRRERERQSGKRGK